MRGKSSIPLGNAGGWRGKRSVFQLQKAKLGHKADPGLTGGHYFLSMTGTLLVPYYLQAGCLSQESLSREGPTSGAVNGPHLEAALLAFVWNNGAPMIPHSC